MTDHVSFGGLVPDGVRHIRQILPDDITLALHRVASGESTIDDANLLRNVIDSQAARLRVYELAEDCDPWHILTGCQLCHSGQVTRFVMSGKPPGAVVYLYYCEQHAPDGAGLIEDEDE
jgi:hypothetical protein